MNDGIGISTSTKATTLRCAIYTRVSTDHGLDQDFNSLDAQREACEAFIKSQTNEGWRLDPAGYDDGGFSGGTTHRPALQRLLDAIKVNEIDIVVVYKVDRLTRSLADFAKLVELFDRHGVSFVSVTQAFNTTNSMGRLTLNVLLSFAQFEREVTGERIRDKIAASKKKGMRMGGPVPLGYALKDKKLIPHEIEAETVRLIFMRYLELGSIALTVEELSIKKIKTKASFRKDGTQRGGIPFTKGPLAFLLRNRTYIGEIIHKGQHYQGEHEAIVPKQLFEAVQKTLTNNGNTEPRYRLNNDALLRGILFNSDGELMLPVTTKKGSARYRYYQSPRKNRTSMNPETIISRVPANDVEKEILEFLKKHCSELKIKDDYSFTNKCGKEISIKKIIKRIVIYPDRLDVELVNECASISNIQPDILIREISFFTKRRNRLNVEVIKMEEPYIIRSTEIRSETRARLVANIARAHLWLDELVQKKYVDTQEIAKWEKISEKTVRNLISLAFLNREIIKLYLTLNFCSKQ